MFHSVIVRTGAQWMTDYVDGRDMLTDGEVVSERNGLVRAVRVDSLAQLQDMLDDARYYSTQKFSRDAGVGPIVRAARAALPRLQALADAWPSTPTDSWPTVDERIDRITQLLAATADR